MVEAARSKGLFLMEAMWTRFLPTYRSLVQLLGEGEIGEPLLIEADFGFRRPVDPGHRLFDLNLGGGSLLDVGIYPVQLCSLVLGQPDRVVADGHVGSTGVDEVVAAVLHHPGGRLGIVKAATRVSLSSSGRIAGTRGSIDIPLMHCPDHLVLRTADREERIEGPFDGNGLCFQVLAVQRCLAEGLTECSTMTLDETLAIAATLDRIRASLGVVYPGE